MTAKNRQLDEQPDDRLDKLRKSLLRNDTLGLDNQFCYLYDSEHIGLNKIALYSLTNEKMVKLFVGRREIFDELKRVYADVSEMLKTLSKNIHIYSYEALSLLIAADDDAVT